MLASGLVVNKGRFRVRYVLIRCIQSRPCFCFVARMKNRVGDWVKADVREARDYHLEMTNLERGVSKKGQRCVYTCVSGLAQENVCLHQQDKRRAVLSSLPTNFSAHSPYLAARLVSNAQAIVIEAKPCLSHRIPQHQ